MPGIFRDTCDMAKKKSSSRRWIEDHEKDEYVLRARREGYRSRACYKLLELDERYGLLRPGLAVVDLGAAPGGWSQVARQKVGASGFVVGLDLLDMDPLEGVEFIQGDFTEDGSLQLLMEKLDGRPVGEYSGRSRETLAPRTVGRPMCPWASLRMLWQPQPSW